VDLGRAVRRGRLRTAAGLLAACLAALTLAGPAGAQPAETDDEGGTAALREQLQAASKGFLTAKAKVAASKKRQRQLAGQLKIIQADMTARTAVVGELAGVAYRGGRIGMVSALLDSDSPDALMDRVGALDAVAANQNKQLRALLKTRAQVTRARAAIANEIAQQQKQVAVMAARKKQAEAALVAAGRDGGPANGSGGGGSASARPAPRNPDGSFPDESCSLNDPTTSGCITPRTLNALRQAQAAGFRRFVSCFRSGGGGEHPIGQACDFAAQQDGFGGVATGAAKEYGDNLADYFITNADRLGVLYVIWFRRIWLPSSGWRAYNGGGDPSSNHENHVHLSVV
jgi:hypothetical protein